MRPVYLSVEFWRKKKRYLRKSVNRDKEKEKDRMGNLFLPQGNETWPENAKEKKNLATIYIESLFYFDLKNKMLIMKENWRKSITR